MTVLRGGLVVDPASGREEVADVVFDGAEIIEVGGSVDATGHEELDCSGAVVCPGFVDLHVHFREPGGEDAETIQTGSRAAAAGGYTAVCPMPNTDPAADSAAIVEMMWRRGREVGLVDVFPIGAVTAGRAGHELAPMRELAASAARVRLFSDDGDPIPTAQLARRAMEYAVALDSVIVEHAEDPSLRVGDMNEGEVSAVLGLDGIPGDAEEICIYRDCVLSASTGARLHIAHLSTAAGAEVVRRARAAGVRVTCEVTPHHLSLTDEAVRTYDTRFKVAPPLRTAADVNGLKAALVDGVVDAIATDHAPHAEHAKDDVFSHAPCGMLGLETALGVSYAELVASDLIGVRRFVELMSTGPARILGADDHGGPIAAGRPATLTVFDPSVTWTIDPATQHSRSRNTPFVGHKMQGQVMHTILRGAFTLRDGQVTS